MLISGTPPDSCGVVRRHSIKKEAELMNTDIAKGKMKQVKGKVNEDAGKVNGDKSREIRGKTEQVAGKLQEEYGRAKRRIEKATGA
jgi:uncharacterized protein YjbJ (UPF0337 family)